MIPRFLAQLLVLSLVLCGCTRNEETAAPAVVPAAPEPAAAHGPSGLPHEAGGIPWFDGSVDEAFRAAAEQNRPLYFYWGAIWCPPCQEIKNTVFKSATFLALSNLFIPVYLDGDSVQAQRVGERFGVKGYPTMIVFNSAGKEVTRIPGGIEINRYTQVLELALNRLQPVSDLVQTALSEPDKLGGAEFTQLAFYSWGQDNGVIPEGRAVEIFRVLADAAAAYPVAGARLYLQSLVSATEEDEEARLAAEEAKAAQERLRAILQDDEVALASWEYLTYYSVPLVKLVGADAASGADLRTLWASRTAELRKSPTLSTADRLGGWFPAAELYFEWNPDGALPDATSRELQADVVWADNITQSPYARQSVIYIASELLATAHLTEQAEVLLRAELERSKSPYYFMSDLAALAEKRGDKAAAVDWLERAYLAAEGPATRLQWGASYVRGVIRLKPEAKQLIADQSIELLAIVPDNVELFSGRNYRVLKRLADELAKWKEQANPGVSLDPFYRQIADRCAAVDANSQPGLNCTTLVAL